MTSSRPNRVASLSRRTKTIAAMSLLAVVVVGVALASRSWWTATATAQTRPAAGAPVTGARPQGSTQIPRPTATTATEAKVVAVVNGQSISREQLAQEAVRRYGKEVVENLVNKHLILQACQQQQVTVTAQEIEMEIDHMATKFGLSKDRWMEMLKNERNINPAQYRNDIIWPTIALRKAQPPATCRSRRPKSPRRSKRSTARSDKCG